MLIAKIENGAVSQIADYRQMFPNTSFTGAPRADFLESHNCLKVSESLPHDRDTQKLERTEPYIDGDFVRRVKVVDKTQEEIDDATEAEATRVRKQRDSLLADTDWRVIRATETGTAMETEWADYRQALRDLTQQTGFPSNVEWPVSPDAPE